MNDQEDKIRVNSIVQVTDESHYWFPALVVVSELKGFGIQSYTHVIGNEGPAGQAYIRLKKGQYEWCGHAVVSTNEYVEEGGEG